MTVETVPIQGTFDIARGRNVLRAKIAARGWQPTFNARAAAALTALGELILLSEPGRLIPVKVELMDGNRSAGIALSCTLPLPDDNYARLDDARERLSRATDQLEFDETGNSIRIVVHIWVS